jgi:predicted Holliday junction resolvase-like endonuclease
MSVQFLLFVIAILLVSIFWELSKINSCLKKVLLMKKEQEYERTKKVEAGQEAR